MANVNILKGVTVPADKHELVLSGSDIVKAIEEDGILDAFYELKHLNYVSISAGLKDLSPKFGQLTSVTSLVLHGNKLQTLPAEIGLLTKLKHLDISSNSLLTVPDELLLLCQLTSLNVSMNCLTTLPSFRENVKLTTLNASCNKLSNFPDCCYTELPLLSEILLSNNEILSIPNSINKLHGLKTLDVSCNKITEVPPEISHLIKLKDLKLKDNPIKDKRLKKMIDQCHNKKVIDYIRHNVGKQSGSHAARKELLRASLSEDKENETNVTNEPERKPKYIINVLKPQDKAVEVHISSAVKTVRAGIICCIVRNVSFTNENFQKFIQMQNKFHDSVCDKRTKATIGTHDLKSVQPPLKYVTNVPTEVTFIPLGSSEPCTPAEFVANKKLEIANLKKEKKRSWNSGLYQYIHLLEGWKEYPMLIDGNDRVISLPPVTNSEISKVSLNTTDMLIEVTSSNDKKLVREITDKFMKEIVQLGIGKKSSNKGEDNDSVEGMICLEQVTLVPEKGPKMYYPSGSDLNFAPSSDFTRKDIDPSKLE